MAGYVNTIEIIIINIHTDRTVCGAEIDKFFIDKRILFVIVTRHHDLSGRNSVVECHLAKVDVDGSNPFARSIFLTERRHSQVAKAAVCKTVIPRFKSGCRLQTLRGQRFSACPLFLRAGVGSRATTARQSRFKDTLANQQRGGGYDFIRSPVQIDFCAACVILMRNHLFGNSPFI
jgi:hypothetical protein